MKKFFIKSILFFGLVISVISFILFFYGGYVDYYYPKFVSPPATSLILGDSRSFQGIQPQVIDTYFKDTNLDLNVLNYSFTIVEVAYGEPYKQSIIRKLDPNTKNGIFILSVHPFVLSARDENDNPEKNIYFETNLPPNNMQNVNLKLNVEYFFRNFDYFHFRGILRKTSETHKNGWLEETNLPDDKELLAKWKKKQIELYTGFAKKWRKSPKRLQSLDEISKILKKYGNVFLVRLPIDKEFIELENNYWPNFDKDMQDLCYRNGLDYINFTVNNHFKTYDGIHIDKFKGVNFTNTLCDSIAANFHQ